MLNGDQRIHSRDGGLTTPGKAKLENSAGSCVHRGCPPTSGTHEMSNSNDTRGKKEELGLFSYKVFILPVE